MVASPCPSLCVESWQQARLQPALWLLALRPEGEPHRPGKRRLPGTSPSAARLLWVPGGFRLRALSSSGAAPLTIGAKARGRTPSAWGWMLPGGVPHRQQGLHAERASQDTCAPAVPQRRSAMPKGTFVRVLPQAPRARAHSRYTRHVSSTRARDCARAHRLAQPGSPLDSNPLLFLHPGGRGPTSS